MRLSTITENLWGSKAKVSYLLMAAAILMFTLLGTRDLWTQEHRWADIVWGMFYRHDFLHPYIGEETYYDKPLLSYWLMALTAQLTGLSTWALRLPSALAGMLAVWSICRLGTKLKNKEMGLLSGWILVTSFFFIFWARVSSADMLNLAGSLFAISWYIDKKEEPFTLVNCSIFFIILAFTSLCKGLVGAVVPVIAVVTDICLQKSWKKYNYLVILFGILIAVAIYFAPFIASDYIGGNEYDESGLYDVFRENILRYFKPFDHEGPIYTYIVYLPVYLMPWSLFFIPALASLTSRWKSLTSNSKWITWTLLALFLFFSLSGSRRSYYVLPILPFAILLTSDWILSKAPSVIREKWISILAILSFVFIFITVDVLAPIYYSKYGIARYATLLQEEVDKIKPLNQWNVIMLDAESKLDFYLRLSPSTQHYDLIGERKHQSSESLLMNWPILSDKPKNTIFITRQIYAAQLQKYFTDYRAVEMPSERSDFLRKYLGLDSAIAYIPNK